ncbi:MAG TPA: NAD(P)/FAD-dependent oxidoreductase, partial [Burkholderiaceae bacterium]|nr:NAD(P)/FAD-dependent oxidoreductase [Burkholderiaceae bacterium]
MLGSAAAPTITRRDFLDGVAVAAGALFAGGAHGATAAADPDPPARTGLQGQTDATRAVAHAWRDDPARWRDATPRVDPEVEDLVVVGAGLSGLAGAHLFQRHAGRPVRILLLDPLDDFGGHARRNEFTSRSGVRLVGYGGSQSLDSPGLFSPAAKSLLGEVGVDLDQFRSKFYDADWTRRHKVQGRGLYFPGGPGPRGGGRLVVRASGEKPAAWISRTALSERARAELLRLLTVERDVMPGMAAEARRARLAGMNYGDFLSTLWRVHPEVLAFYERDTLGYFGVGIDATSALDAWAAGLPGFAGLKLGKAVDKRMSPSGRQLMASEDDYIYHFPDGNAGVARALLRALNPAAMPGQGMASLADGRADYAQLDVADRPVRLRLRATV